MRQPGIEPGSRPWKGPMLAITPLAHRVPKGTIPNRISSNLILTVDLRVKRNFSLLT